MNIEIKVVTNAKKREIRREGESLRVKLLSLPREGKANGELIETLADLFRVRKSDVKILRGERDRKKLVCVPVSKEEFEVLPDNSEAGD
jgi:uncharacterized protein (TIGR00251 family)